MYIVHSCGWTLIKTGRSHIGVGSITSLVANDEVVFKVVFFQSCQGIQKLTDSQLGTLNDVTEVEFCNRVQVSKPAQSTWSIYCTQLVKSRILRHSRFG
jgi:hypothetical protein